MSYEREIKKNEKLINQFEENFYKNKEKLLEFHPHNNHYIETYLMVNK
jgi:hypothetical protein